MSEILQIHFVAETLHQQNCKINFDSINQPLTAQRVNNTTAEELLKSDFHVLRNSD